MSKSTMEKITDFYQVVSDNSIIGNYLSKKNNEEKFQDFYVEGAPLYMKIYLF